MPRLYWNGRETAVVPFESGRWTLCESPEWSRGRADSANRIVQGDNLPVLNMLLPPLSGKIKCVYIDPPYNAGNAVSPYADRRRQDEWLSMIYPRLLILRDFLTPDGSIWISIDDHECHCLKVLCDEIFGRCNFISCITVKMSHLSGVKMSHTSKRIPKLKEYVLCYAFDKSRVELHADYEPSTWSDSLSRYTQYIVNYDEDYTHWRLLPVRRVAREYGIDPKDERSYERFLIDHADRIVRTARNRSLDRTQCDRSFRRIRTESGRDMLIYGGEEVLFARAKIRELNGRRIPCNRVGDLWTDISINNLHHEGGVGFRGGKKPEKLMRRIIHMASDPGDFVLDAFLGSGTTATVAQKMARHYIGIESGPQAITHCVARLQSEMSEESEGFRFFQLKEQVRP